MDDKIIQLPDGRTVSFPSSMSDDDIAKAIRGDQKPQRTLGQKMLGTVTDPMLRMVQNMGQLQNAPDVGGKVGAGLGMMNAGAQLGMASTGLPAAETALRSVPSNPFLAPYPMNAEGVADIVGAIPKGLGWLGEKIVQGGLSPFGNLGTSPESAQKIKSEMGELGGTAMQIFAPVAVGKTLPKIGAALKERSLGKAVEEIKSVAPPVKKELAYNETLKRALPYIAEAERANSIKSANPVERVREAASIIGDSAEKLWSEKVLPQIEKHPTETIDLAPIKDAVFSVVDDNMMRHDAKKAQAISDYSDTFKGQVPMMDVQKLITTLNAETNRFNKASGAEKALMLNQDPVLEAKINAVDALREQLFSKLADLGETATPELRKDYGALSFVKQALDRNIVRSEKTSASGVLGRFSSPTGVALATEGIGLGLMNHPKATLGAIAAGALRDYVIHRNAPNPSITRAFDRLAKSNLAPRDATSAINQLYPSFKTSAQKGVKMIPAHKTLVESHGLKYMGTDPQGNIGFDNHSGSTGLIPKGATAQEIADIVAKTKAKP